MSDNKIIPITPEEAYSSPIQNQIYPNPVDNRVKYENVQVNEADSNKTVNPFRFEVLIYLIVLFVIVFMFAYFMGNNLLPADGKFTLIAETYYFPVKLVYSFFVAGLTYLIILSYYPGKKSRFIWLLLTTFFVGPQVMGVVMSSTLSDWLQINMQLEPKVEYALVFAGFVTYFRVVLVAVASLRSVYHNNIANYKIIVTLVGSVFIIAAPIVLRKYAVDNYNQAQKNVQAFRLPNSQIYSVSSVPTEPIDSKKTQWSYRLNYPQLLLGDGRNSESDDLYIFKTEYGQSLSDLCGSVDYKVTDFGLNYGLTIKEGNSSNPPKDENKYQEKYLCFRIGEVKYLLRRSDNYDFKSYEQYSDDAILSEFFNNDTFYHQRATFNK